MGKLFITRKGGAESSDVLVRCLPWDRSPRRRIRRGIRGLGTAKQSVRFGKKVGAETENNSVQRETVVNDSPRLRAGYTKEVLNPVREELTDRC